MKPDSQVRFCIIGLGNLLEVIWPCITQSLGGDDLPSRAIATTADESDLKRKRDFFKIPVQLTGNLEALKANRPDIIFFAPPPTIAPGEIDSTLSAYFEWVRQEGLDIPEIYAFPPMPPGQYYRDVLGADLRVTNIIPNNVTRVAGQPVQGEGYYACSFSGDWPAESRERLARVFASQGALVELPHEQIVPMLGGTCTFFSLWQVIPVLAEILQNNGHQFTHQQLGEYMRARCQEISGYAPDVSYPASLSAVTGPVSGFLDEVLQAWREGVIQYYREIDFPPQAARTIVDRGFDIILHTTQREPRQVLDGHAIGAATKGGVLEKAITTFHSLTKPVLERGVTDLALGVSTQWRQELSAKVNETAHIVGRHGQKLAG